jgi:hypothetical protein
MKQSKNICLWVAFFIVAGCALPERGKPVTIDWENNKATSLIIPNSLVSGISIETLSTDILVTLGDSTNQPILGEFTQNDSAVIFRPLVPFTRGLHYHVTYQMRLVGDFDIPVDENAKAPQLRIYPSADTVPENLLKMYFQFTEPMVEGQSLWHIHLLNERGDTLPDTFLDLQPELWNTEGTLLTLWLDPGRVKRDLIPNKTQGNPIVKGSRYTLHVSTAWQSKQGKELQETLSKSFYVATRDEKIPDVNNWKLETPKNGTETPLAVRFPQPLDYALIQSAIIVLDGDGKAVLGKWKTEEVETSAVFTPNEPWKTGKYHLKVESQLEDLAGNNLSRPFDRDLTASKATAEKKYYERAFTIQ